MKKIIIIHKIYNHEVFLYFKIEKLNIYIIAFFIKFNI
jgi:hypothetical protein